jgi:uncharacterized membrane protein YgdD (TMEM256/DUF423 family)
MTTLKEFSEGMDRKSIVRGSLLLALAVVAGAFGAHALQGMLDVRYQQTYQTAVSYHFYHAFALMICGILSSMANLKRIQWSILFFKTGLILFCGSLYALCILTANGYTSFKWLGMITPLGGLSFIVGWIMLAIAIIKDRL